MTERRKRALEILKDNPDIGANHFASLFWPDSKAWNKSYNTGNGATRGKGMWLSAGSYLAKLVKAGLVWRDCSYGHVTFRLSSEGRESVKAADGENG